MTSRTVYLSLLLIPAILVGVPAYWLWTQQRPWESNGIVDTSWVSGGHLIVFRVVDTSGNPLKGIVVRTVDPSSGQGGETDANGECAVGNDGALMTFSLNDVFVMKERDMLFGPEPGPDGWIVTVVVKDLAAIGYGRSGERK